MLQCNGLIAIPSKPKLQFTPWNDSGFFVSFDVVSQEPIRDRSKGSHKIHYYQANMFVNRDRKKHWEELIKPGEIFLIRTADFSSIIREGFTNPICQIKFSEKNFLHLKQAHWHKD